MGNRHRKEKLELCRVCGMPASAEPTNPTVKLYRDRYEQPTGDSLHQSAQYKQGRRLVIEILPRLPYKYAAPSIVSS